MAVIATKTISVAVVACERCQRQQPNRTAQVESPEVFYLGCKSCGYPYARYVKRKVKQRG